MEKVDWFTTAGSHNWVCPVGVDHIKIECIGGGGGGAAAYDANKDGGGGGGGGYARVNVYSTIPGQTYTLYVGSGGAGGTSGNHGTEGEQTYFCYGATVVCYASPGQGGERGGSGGSPGFGHIGDVKYTGGYGFHATNGFGAGGGSPACETSNGNNAAGKLGAEITVSGMIYNGGDGGTHGLSPTSGYGGGGGGAYWIDESGGNGRQGMIKITYESPI
jgi:hypothetical protein